MARQAPLSWDSPGVNTGVGCNFLFQGIFLTRGLNVHLLHVLIWQADSSLLCHLGSLLQKIHSLNKCLLSPYCVRGSGEKHHKTATVSALLTETFLWEKQVKVSMFIFMNKGTGMETENLGEGSSFRQHSQERLLRHHHLAS